MCGTLPPHANALIIPEKESTECLSLFGSGSVPVYAQPSVDSCRTHDWIGDCLCVGKDLHIGVGTALGHPLEEALVPGQPLGHGATVDGGRWTLRAARAMRREYEETGSHGERLQESEHETST